jgi:hypothetical protein
LSNSVLLATPSFVLELYGALFLRLHEKEEKICSCVWAEAAEGATSDKDEVGSGPQIGLENTG